MVCEHSDKKISILGTNLQEDEYVDISLHYHLFLELLTGLLTLPQGLGKNFPANIKVISKLFEIIDVLFMQFIGFLWINEIPICWDLINKFSKRPKKIPIPTYCFIKKHYEIPKKKAPLVLTKRLLLRKKNLFESAFKRNLGECTRKSLQWS